MDKKYFEDQLRFINNTYDYFKNPKKYDVKEKGRPKKPKEE